MKKHELSTLDTTQLVEQFAAIGLEQDQAILANENAKYNRLYQRMAGVVDELRRRLGDQRRQLVQLFSSPNMQVQLKAAIHTLAVAPEAARNQLQIIADAHWYPQTADAFGMLRSLADGSYTPV